MSARPGSCSGGHCASYKDTCYRPLHPTLRHSTPVSPVLSSFLFSFGSPFPTYIKRSFRLGLPSVETSQSVHTQQFPIGLGNALDCLFFRAAAAGNVRCQQRTPRLLPVPAAVTVPQPSLAMADISALFPENHPALLTQL